MKIQNLAVIFIIIIMPITMILNAYTTNQLKTLNFQTSYDTKLSNATYDALKAFQLNTINSSTSDLSNSKIRDIEASANTFFNSIASNFNMSGYNQDILKEYVPALVYTMYDGYYIYSPFVNKLSPNEYTATSKYKDNEKIYGIKPYIFYSCRYKYSGNDFIITYSLDNYITIQGLVNGNNVNKSGYLVDNIIVSGSSVKYRDVEITPESFLKEYIDANNSTTSVNYVKRNGVKYYNEGGIWYTFLNGVKYEGQTPMDFDGVSEDNSAVKYYTEANEFKTWINANLSGLKTSNAVDEEGNLLDVFGNEKIFDFDTGEGIEEPNSKFNEHRLSVIRYSIEKNLSIAIANYNNYVGSGKSNFLMPKLREDEWDKILNNISIISFLQGLNIGGKIYNGYSIITNNKNKEVVTEESIYIADNEEYHNMKENKLDERPDILSLKGFLNIDFERVSRTIEDGIIVNFYPKTQIGSYTSVVNQTNVNEAENIYKYLEDKKKLAKVYYTALARERYSMYKANNIIKINSDLPPTPTPTPPPPPTPPPTPPPAPGPVFVPGDSKFVTVQKGYDTNIYYKWNAVTNIWEVSYDASFEISYSYVDGEYIGNVPRTNIEHLYSTAIPPPYNGTVNGQLVIINNPGYDVRVIFQGVVSKPGHWE